MTDLWPTLHKAKEADAIEDIFTAETGNTCPTCEDAAALTEAGHEVVCSRCGTVVDVPLDWSAEYRWFSADSGGGPDPSRCGFPINPLLPESSLGTVILNQRQSPIMRRIKRYHMWNLMPYRERTLWGVFESLTVRASNAGIGGAVLEEAKELYAQLTASQICRGQPQRDSMLAACLWEGLKRHGSPRLPKDIAEIFQLPSHAVTKGIKQFQHILTVRAVDQKTDTYASGLSGLSGLTGLSGLSALEGKEGSQKDTEKEKESDAIISARIMQRKVLCQGRATRTTSYEDFIQPFLTNLSIPRASQPLLEHMVRSVCARTEELSVVPENTPPSLTASVIAFCMTEIGLPVDHTEIARICGISVVTIQKCLKRMAPSRSALLNLCPE